MGGGKKEMKCKVEVEHVSGFMCVTVNQWPELMRWYTPLGTRAGKRLFWCTLESGEFQKCGIW